MRWRLGKTRPKVVEEIPIGDDYVIQRVQVTLIPERPIPLEETLIIEGEFDFENLDEIDVAPKLEENPKNTPRIHRK